MKPHKVFHFYKNNKAATGYSRGLIYDLQRGRSEFVPNELIEVLPLFEGKSKEDILTVFADHSEVAAEYIDMLIGQGYANFIDSHLHSLFQPISDTWEYPGLISNAHLDNFLPT